MADKARLVVYVVDDDREFAHSLTGLLAADGFTAQSFSSGQSFLEALPEMVPGPILLDVKMPVTDGISVLKTMKEMRIDWPVVIMTGHGDVPLAVRCIQSGAIEFIEKPFEESRLLEALGEAMQVLEIRLAAHDEARTLEQRLTSLSKREREVLERLTSGLTNKQIGMALDLSVRTVEMHRANLMRRLRVKTTPDAIRIALEHGILTPREQF